MSDHFIALVPTDPKARPSAEVLTSLIEELKKTCGTDEARVKDFHDRLQFIDCGENFEAIQCPTCNANLDQDWWGKRMDHAWDDDTGFHLCDFDTPCCDGTARLDTLKYSPTQGFSTWFVSARNPNRGSLNPAEMATLDMIAGLPLRVIYQMY